jgi:putative transposase
VAYRTIKINWQPRNQAQWTAFKAARRESARLWSDLVELHFDIRTSGERWPTKEDLQKEFKGKYPNLHSQSIQQIIGEFVEAVSASRQLRKNGASPEEAKYPYRKSEFRDIVYTNQGAKIRDRYLMLPNGEAGTLKVKLPAIEIVGRLMEVRLCFHSIILVCEIADEIKLVESIIGVDLGVNTLIAAANEDKAVLISGRALKADIQYRNKELAHISSLMSHKVKGSRAWKRLRRAKARLLARSERRLNDKLHKATRKVADEFPNAKAYVGKPFNDAAQKLNRRQSQQVSSASNAKIIRMLDYKLAGAIQVDEHFTSQTCHVCGARQKARRIYQCKQCGTRLPRDVNGALNIRSIGLHNQMLSGGSLPQSIKFKYPENFSGSTRGHRASRSLRREAARL